jgi:hypothetical protein
MICLLARQLHSLTQLTIQQPRTSYLRTDAELTSSSWPTTLKTCFQWRDRMLGERRSASSGTDL